MEFWDNESCVAAPLGSGNKNKDLVWVYAMGPF